MSAITSSVGLISGLPIQDLVDSLILAQRRPIDLLQSRLGLLSSRRTGLLQISAQLLSIRNIATGFKSADFFSGATTASSDETSLLASGSVSAAPGEYTFRVHSLASSHQLISAGFADPNTAPVGAGTLTLESSAGTLNQSSELSSLNGGAGVQVGRIRITDGSGASAEVDLVGARTIDDVVTAINQAAVSVEARVEGDGLVLEDLTGGTGTLSVSEVGDGRTAADLGILRSASGATLIGDTLVSVTGDSLLSTLNDGNGVRNRAGFEDLEVTLSDGSVLAFHLSEELRAETPLAVLNHGNGIPDGTIRITDRSGGSAEIDLTGLTTVQDVFDAINDADGIDVLASFNGLGLRITDQSIEEGATAANDLLIEDVTGTAAAALGIEGTSAGGTINGDQIHAVRTVSDLLNLINLHPDSAGRLQASLSADGLGLTLEDLSGGAGTFSVTPSNTADDLGLGAAVGSTINSRRLVAGLNTVLVRSLNGGQGADLSDLQLQDRAGNTASLDATGTQSLADLIEQINNAGTAIRASVSSSGLGIVLTDESGGSGNLVISGVTADALGLAVDDSVDSVSSGNLQRQYLSEATRFEDLNHGDGLPRGRFTITDSLGNVNVIDLTQGNERTVHDILAEITAREHLTARINDTGDGILIEDTAGGAGQLRVTEEGGSVARALGILGEAEAGSNFIDGSFETRIEVGPQDSLNDVLTAIRDSDAEINAAIINDGSSGRPHRLSLTSLRSGRAGAVAIDVGTTDLSFDTLSVARDAVVVFGDGLGDRPLVLGSSSNTLTGVIDGVRLDLVGASETPVTISVARDVDGMVDQARDFVNAFNDVISVLDDLTSFDAETEARGILQGDSTARRIRQVLAGLPGKTVDGIDSGFNRLGSVGINLAGGGRLSLDEDAFRSAVVENAEAVEDLFSLNETDEDGEVIRTGLAGIIESEIDRLTDSDTGTISLRDDALQTSEDQLAERISQLEQLLEVRRARLFDEFNAMEQVIANLQSQQSALGAISSQLSLFQTA